jgi:hypothetical protein
MVKEFLARAKEGNPVYISSVCDAFENLKENEKQLMYLVVKLLNNKDKLFKLSLPSLDNLDKEELDFVKSYIWAEIYNILSSLGGKSVTVYIDSSNSGMYQIASELNDVFYVNSKLSERQGYGRCINVIDRMLNTLCPGEPGFKFIVKDIKQMPEVKSESEQRTHNPEIFAKVTRNLNEKVICGMDVGGTDIKIVLVKDGKIDCYKEYDWFPASFKLSRQLIDPICLIVRLIRAKISLDAVNENSSQKSYFTNEIEKALDKSASDEFILQTVESTENFLNGKYIDIDAIGLCFPDVVVKNKIVGGEVYKTRGIRNNPDIEYESDFLQLTNLDERLRKLIKKDGSVNIINDGPMASFTAAVESYASETPDKVEKGVFAHTLGTELGTGWVDGSGDIPDIPLEVYNFIIDLGSFGEKEFQPDDLRSINNFNTGLPGTLQKYCSQSGIFRLAMKYFPKARPDLYKELFEKGYVVDEEIDGIKGLFVPTEPKDMRKPFLEHMMSLPERENDEINDKIWRDMGEFLAVTWIETKKILNPDTDARVLFGRLVKNKRCFELMCEGAKSIEKDAVLEIADAEMANTSLMKQLKDNPHYTVAQFAQAVGAVYFGNINNN